MQATRGQVVGHGRVLGAEQVSSLYPFRTFSDFNLPEDDLQVLSLFTAADFPQLSPFQQKDVLDLLDQFSDIFASGPTDYGLAKGVIHHIDTGDVPPSCAKPYRRSRVEDAQVSKELIKWVQLQSLLAACF
ncbi:hypothetical protein DSO57_1016746 [Entomophthora muscae]|uniref:Uncharacterized protein n=1 Tax=Entomophthora muscae TaxID=34485 RepID=A0ACC2TRR1_9FUNG|nr:hypothetical protein DSO57_1016746 [Entomophthora muscae]